MSIYGNLKMNFKFSLFKLIQNQVRLMSNRNSKNHYDSLGVSSNSTQGEIKSAYYKLSMVYHPDKNQGNEADSKRFRDITAAYEVLGNVKTRKMYDKGLYFQERTVDDTVDKFHKSRETRSRPPPPSGRTPIYDFDEWSKNHYGATFQRQMEHKRKQRIYHMKQQQKVEDVKMEKLIFVIAALTFVCMWLFHIRHQTYDNVSTFNDSIITSKRKKE